MITEVQNYFIHQSEIYGKDFYLDLKKSSSVVTEPPPTTQTIEQFNSEIKDCHKCELSKSRTQLVFGSGASDAKLMCVGQAPDSDSDKQGRPFSGATWELLSKILLAIKFPIDDIYFANVIKCHPPENRDPQEIEITECLPFLNTQIELIKPVVILALGRTAAQSLLGVRESVVSLREKENYYRDIPVFVTHHPGDLLKNSELKRATWEDVQKLRKVFDELAN